MFGRKPFVAALAAVTSMACGPEVVAYTAPALTEDAGSEQAPPPTEQDAGPQCGETFLREVLANGCKVDLDDPCAPGFIQNSQSWLDQFAAVFPLPDADAGVAGESRQLGRCDLVDFGYPDPDETQNAFIVCDQACRGIVFFLSWCTDLGVCELATGAKPSM